MSRKFEFRRSTAIDSLLDIQANTSGGSAFGHPQRSIPLNFQTTKKKSSGSIRLDVKGLVVLSDSWYLGLGSLRIPKKGPSNGKVNEPV